MVIETLKMGPYGTNVYLVKFDDSVVVIDPSDDAKRISDAIVGYRLVGIILTHGHFDHFSSLQTLIDKHPGVDVYLHEKAIPKLTDRKLNVSYVIKGFVTADLTHANVHTIAEGSVIRFSEQVKFEVIETPGHTDCSVALYLGDMVFVGDTIFHHFIGMYRYRTGNLDDLRKSCQRIVETTQVFKVLAGHYEPCTTEDIRMHNEEYQRLIKK